MAATKLSVTKLASRTINYAEKRAVRKSDLNCDADYMKSSFKAPRGLYGRTDGNQGHVIIRSFRPDEVTPEQCNQLGLELAEKLVPNHQVTVYTHNDTDYVYNHIVVSSIDLEADKKSSNNKQALRNIRDSNGEICREHGLSISERDTTKLRYTQAEKALIEKDQYSWKDDLQEKVENAKDHTGSFKSFSEHLEKFGTELRIKGKNASYKPEDVNKWVHGKILGEDYDKGVLEYRFEGREREEGKESEQDAVAAYTNQFEVD